MKTLSGFESNDNRFNLNKYIRQLRGVVSWKRNGFQGTLEYATGVGKTVCAFIAMNKIARKRHFKALVIVPTRQLKGQWEKQIMNQDLGSSVDVLVVNTIALKEIKYTYDLVVIDEIHKMAADKFSTIFEKVSYKWMLGLTATMERLDGKHELLEKYAPIIDTITQREAIERGWIADFIEFNLAVPLSRDESDKLTNMGQQIRYFMTKFNDFDHMISCLNAKNAANYATSKGIETSEVTKWATQGMRLTHERKELFETSERKVDVAVELINELKVRTMVFSQSTIFSQELAKQLDDCVEYHTKIQSLDVKERKKKHYKSESAALKFKEDVKKKYGSEAQVQFRKSKGGYTIYWREAKRRSGSYMAKRNLEGFEEGKYRTLVAAKALDQGTDIPDVRLGVDGSRTSSVTQHTQRTGRIARDYVEDGKSVTKVYVNLYVPDYCVPNSPDEKKLRACQVKGVEVMWVDDVEELKEMLNKIIVERALG